MVKRLSNETIKGARPYHQQTVRESAHHGNRRERTGSKARGISYALCSDRARSQREDVARVMTTFRYYVCLGVADVGFVGVEGSCRRVETAMSLYAQEQADVNGNRGKSGSMRGHKGNESSRSDYHRRHLAMRNPKRTPYGPAYPIGICTD